MNRFWHWGQLGDVNYSLPTVKALGGGEIYTSIRGARFDFLAPLLRAQPYVSDVVCDPRGRMEHWEYTPAGVTHDLNSFRAQCNNIARVHLAVSHAKPFRAEVDPAVPWLVPDPAWGPMGCNPGLIVARSFRYRHPKGRALYPTDTNAWFVGLPEEAIDFGLRLFPVKDAWELACMIWQAGKFAGNQSFPLSVAVGLGVPHYIETEPNCDNCLIEADWQTRLC